MVTEVKAQITGTVWKVDVRKGDQVAVGQPLVVLESMKMEVPVESPAEGRVAEIRVQESQAVEEGETLVVLA
jgi:acetyl-CoA carboxylase biotin carboxyl carrier protein